jgi:hypothetical protein
MYFYLPRLLILEFTLSQKLNHDLLHSQKRGALRYFITFALNRYKREHSGKIARIVVGHVAGGGIQGLLHQLGVNLLIEQ